VSSMWKDRGKRRERKREKTTGLRSETGKGGSKLAS